MAISFPVSPHINSVFFQYCLLTMYFQNPNEICAGTFPSTILYMQKGSSFSQENLLRFEDVLSAAEALPEKWQMEKYFPGMGFHITPKEKSPYDCKMAVPIQGLYAHINGECLNSGFVFAHFNTKTKGHG